MPEISASTTPFETQRVDTADEDESIGMSCGRRRNPIVHSERIDSLVLEL